MELKLVSKDKNSMRMEFTQRDETLIYPLVHALLQDKDVAEAQYTMGHPELEKPVLFLKVKDGKPQSAIRRAVKKLQGQIEECQTALDKALK